jgi:hypothetical protein
VKSIIRILSASSVDSCRGGTCGWTVVAACFTVALSLAQWWAAENGLALVACTDECGIARRGGRCQAAVLPSMVEHSSWLEWAERFPSMEWL